MGIITNKIFKGGRRGIFFIFLGGCLFLFSSCSSTCDCAKPLEATEVVSKTTPNAAATSPAQAAVVANLNNKPSGKAGSATPGKVEEPEEKKVEPEASIDPGIEHVAHRSEDYVVVMLQGGETSSNLAKKYLGDAGKFWVIEDANEGLSFVKDQMVVIPLKEENKGGLAAEGYQVVPILCYHDFAENCGSHLCIPSGVFDQQMKYLKDNGYRVISLDELYGFLQFRRAIPKKSVVVTLDGGYGSAYHIAYPTLKKYGFTATLFVYTSFVGSSKNAISWKQLKEMKADGFGVGSQTVTHRDLTKRLIWEKSQPYLKRIKKELMLSKQIIDKKIDQETIYFAPPYGNINQLILGLSERAGYKVMLSLERDANPFFSDPFYLKREQIFNRDLGSFAKRIKTFTEFQKGK